MPLPKIDSKARVIGPSFFGNGEQNAVRHGDAIVDIREDLKVEAETALHFAGEVPGVRAENDEVSFEILELLFRRLEGAELGRAIGAPSTSEETYDKGSLTPQLLGRNQATIGIRQQEVRRSVANIQGARCEVVLPDPVYEKVVSLPICWSERGKQITPSICHSSSCFRGPSIKNTHTQISERSTNRCLPIRYLQLTINAALSVVQ